MEVVVTTGAINRAKLQSNHHHQQTNTQFFTGRMPFLLPNQQCQSTEGKISHSMDLLTTSSPGGLPTLSLTTNSSWLPRGRVAMPLISPLMPVPHPDSNCNTQKLAKQPKHLCMSICKHAEVHSCTHVHFRLTSGIQWSVIGCRSSSVITILYTAAVYTVTL